jgi:hypothetical protein
MLFATCDWLVHFLQLLRQKDEIEFNNLKEKQDMKKLTVKPLCSAMFGLGMLLAVPAFAADTALPEKPQQQSAETKSVQAQIEQQSSSKEAEKRKKIIEEATMALQQTHKALKALEDGKKEDALAALELATGKLELLLSRDPKLALAPLSLDVTTYDLLADPDTVKAVVKEAKHYLDEGEVQKARPLVANLASEIIFTTTSIPLATYPEAIKAISPLIDAGKIDEAKMALRAALNTLVITDEIIPLPVLRADYLLRKAEKLAENMERSEGDNKLLDVLLKDARTQLKLAEVLGYGSRKAFKPLYEQLDQIAKKSAGGKGGKGWFDEIQKLLADMF